MAKIRTISMKVFGQNEDFTINYVAKRSQFTVKLPERLEKYAEESDLYRHGFAAESETALHEKIRELIKKFESQKVVQRKVIAYEFKWSSSNVACNVADYRGMHDTSDAAEIKFEWRVLIEKSVDGIKKYYTEMNWRGNVELSETQDREKDWSFIEWTQDREDFMRSFYASMEALMKKLSAFVDTPEVLLATIDKGWTLLEDKSK